MGSNLPIYVIGSIVAASIALALIGLGSWTTLIGLTVSESYTGFLIYGSLVLWYRLVTPRMPWGAFKLGWARVPLTIIVLTYRLASIVLSFYPPVSFGAVRTFNWSIVVFVGVVALAMARWMLGARKTYTRPKMEVSGRHWMALFNRIAKYDTYRLTPNRVWSEDVFMTLMYGRKERTSFAFMLRSVAVMTLTLIFVRERGNIITGTSILEYVVAKSVRGKRCRKYNHSGIMEQTSRPLTEI